ncbi:MAG: S1 RNA-binding domain-containing protein, partial [Cytophagaceae bacterium]
MIEIGKLNLLKVSRQSPHGFYLVSGEVEVLLPNKYVPDGLEPGDEIEVFVYKDSEDRPVATTLTPLGMLGDFVCLRVKDVSPIGAFMNWGLEKDLLVPLSEQHRKMKLGEKHVVKIAIDPKTERIVGIAKLGGFFSHDLSGIDEGDKVDALIYEITDLGYMAIINNTYKGMIYKNEVFKPIEI